MRVLIPFDGSDSANAALDDLPRAGLPGEAEALILVTHVWLASSPTEFSRAVSWRRMLAADGSSFTPALREEEEGRALAREARRRLRTLFPGWEVKAQAAAGTAAPELLRRAASWGADLVVIGSEGRSWPDRSFGVGHSAVIAAAPCTVRVARPSAVARDGPVRLLVGADAPGEPGSPTRAVASRRWPAGSECRVISPGLIQSGTVESLREAGLRVSAVAPARTGQLALAEEAERWGADCIFVAADGLWTGRAGALTGGLVAQLLASSPCSFEVSRATPRPPAADFMPGARAAQSFTAAGAAG